MTKSTDEAAVERSMESMRLVISHVSDQQDAVARACDVWIRSYVNHWARMSLEEQNSVYGQDACQQHRAELGCLRDQVSIWSRIRQELGLEVQALSQQSAEHRGYIQSDG